jgi:hypothetical protein
LLHHATDYRLGEGAILAKNAQKGSCQPGFPSSRFRIWDLLRISCLVLGISVSMGASEISVFQISTRLISPRRDPLYPHLPRQQSKNQASQDNPRVPHACRSSTPITNNQDVTPTPHFPLPQVGAGYFILGTASSNPCSIVLSASLEVPANSFRMPR